MRRPLARGLVAGLLAAVVAGAAAAQAPGASVQGAWARAQPNRMLMSALYFVLINRTHAPVTLHRVSCEGVRMATLHETVDSAGIMQMVPFDSLVVPANGRLVFQPGGYHAMLMGLSAPLKPGGRLACALVVGASRPVHFTAQVRR